MSNTNYTDTAVYVETESLTGWSTKMSEINTASEEILSEFESSVVSLKDDWKGNSADGFESSLNSCLKSAKSKHNEMGDVEKVIDTMQKQ